MLDEINLNLDLHLNNLLLLLKAFGGGGRQNNTSTLCAQISV